MAKQSARAGKAAAAQVVSLQKDPKRALVFKVKPQPRAGVRTRRQVEDVLVRRAFQARSRFPAVSEVRVLAEGDSWINIVWPISGYPPTLVDSLDMLAGYYVHNIGWPGDEFEDIKNAKQYEQPLKSNSFPFFVFSGGGNDFIGGQSFKNFLRPRAGVAAPVTPAACIDMPAFQAKLATVAAGYRQIAAQTKAWTSRTKLLIHGYDHAIPRTGGQWLGKPLAERGYQPTSQLAKDIVKLMIDSFYEVLKGVAQGSGGRVILVDCRGACAGNWHDELHPNRTASAELARRFAARIPLPAAARRGLVTPAAKAPVKVPANALRPEPPTA
jgi:hypothetical protein